MSNVRYYKGLHRVKVVTESVGYLTIEALEDFDDMVDGEKVKVKSGEKRIVPTDAVYKRKTLPPMVKEHSYELRMEKQLKRIITQKETKEKDAAKA